jgi:hypothetical protein
MFENREILIVTKHKKEKVISPLISKHLKAKTSVATHFDTDLLGTFCGEIERIEDPIATLRMKCKRGLEGTDFKIAIGSEGSFGAHPYILFAPFSEEYMMLYDAEKNMEIIVKEATTHTNFTNSTIQYEDELLQFARKINFPSHGLILRTSAPTNQIEKGIRNEKKLIKTFHEFKKNANSVQIETDMRAMHNPTRMEVIKKLTFKLIQKINSKCTKCMTPGFDIVAMQKGLPCVFCNFPTESTLKAIKQCQSCMHEEEIWYPNNKKFEEPMYCNYCNP